MLLSDRDLLAAVDDGGITLDPFRPEHVQPASIDVCLAPAFRVFANHQHTHIDPRRDQGEMTQLVELGPGEPFVLHPGEFVLGSTVERIGVDVRHAARLEGKSSLGRLGLLVHSTAGFVDPGFEGNVTLELSNVASLPIRLWPGMRIGQLCVFRLTSIASAPYGDPVYGSRYQGQTGPTESRAWQRNNGGHRDLLQGRDDRI